MPAKRQTDPVPTTKSADHVWQTTQKHKANRTQTLFLKGGININQTLTLPPKLQ